MSIYCHLCCVQCREAFHIKDADSKAYVNREADAYTDPLSQFLEKHTKHELRYLREDISIKMPDGTWETPSDEWERFKIPPSGHWSCGAFFDD